MNVEQRPIPKLRCAKHAEFYEEEFVNPAGRRIRVKKIHTKSSTIYSVSVDGVRRSSYMKLTLARKRAKELYQTEGSLPCV